MRLTKQQKKDTLEILNRVLEDFSIRATSGLNISTAFTCNAINTYVAGNTKKDSIALEYFHSQRPASRMNKTFTLHPYYREDRLVWWCKTNEESKQSDDADTTENELVYLEQRILFLKHLINKLKK